MPIYEYRCNSCRRRQSFLVPSARDGFAPVCRFCGSKTLTRLISRVAVLRSEESRLESLADRGRWGDLDESDPKSVARLMKRMGEAVGEDLGDDFDQMAEEAAEETPYSGADSGEGTLQ